MDKTIKEVDGLQFTLTDTPNPEDRDYVHQRIKAFNNAVSEHHRAVRRSGPKPLDIFVHNSRGQLLGGLVAGTYWGWLEIEDLWLDETLRGLGYGRELLTIAEVEALARGCSRVFLQTFGFHAKGFYEKLGYQVVGSLDDYPPGQTFFWMRKDFSPATNHTTHDDEILDVVDRHDTVIGQKRRSELYEAGSSNFRVVNVFLTNAQGQIWIPRRAAHKSIFPLCLDMSMGGHVRNGESYEDALKRELKEELNLDTDSVSCRFLAHLTPHDHNVSAFMKVYEIRTNQTPEYNPDDFVESFWLSPQEVLDRIQKGEHAKGDLPKLIRIFYTEEQTLRHK